MPFYMAVNESRIATATMINLGPVVQVTSLLIRTQMRFIPTGLASARDKFLRPSGSEWKNIVASGMGIEPAFPEFI